MHYLAENRKLLQYQTYLFINISGKTAGHAWKVESVYDMFGRMEKKTGIKLTPHMLRRYFVMERWNVQKALRKKRDDRVRDRLRKMRGIG